MAAGGGGVLDPSMYHCSEVHLAVLKKQHSQLEAILAGLQPVADPSSIRTVAEARADIDVADARSSVVDYRDARTGRETPLHLAVRVADPASVLLLMEAGADWTLQNDRGWNALDEAVRLGHEDIARSILRHSRRIQLEKWCRRRPVVVRSLKLIRDFYAEVTFHFESSLLPFVSRMLPSDTVRVLKRGANVRVDTTLAGFEVFKSRRSERTILFLGESCGSLWVLSHRDRVAKAYDGKRDPPTDGEVEEEVSRMMRKHLIRPGLDVTESRVEPARKGGKAETVGPWSAKAYRMKDAVLSLKSRRALGAAASSSSSDGGNPFDIWSNPEELREHLTEEELRKLDSTLAMIESPQTIDDSSSVIESAGDAESTYNNAEEEQEGKKNKKKKKGLLKNLKKKCGKLTQDAQKKIAPLDIKGKFAARRAATAAASTATATAAGSDDGQDDQELEYKIKFKPDLWLSDDFPLEVKEFLPLLDILGQKSKMILRLREVLSTRLPDGTFPVKVSFPIMRTIKVIVTFTKFEELKPSVEFFTPPSSPEKEAPGAKTLSSLLVTKEEPYFYDPSVMSVSDIKDPFRIPPDYRRT